MKTLTSEEALASTFNLPNPQNCPYCDRLCKNINSYKQHICRCKNNPNRIESVKRDYKLQYEKMSEESKKRMVWNKGLTKETSKSIQAQVEHRPKTHKVQHIYDDYNKEQINKWFMYISNIDICESINVSYHKSGYPTISRCYGKLNENYIILFAHDYIANILLNGKLEKSNTVHHINEDINDFSKYNLLVFRTNDAHKRFHNSKYAKLIYNEETHLFDCIIDRP